MGAGRDFTVNIAISTVSKIIALIPFAMFNELKKYGFRPPTDCGKFGRILWLLMAVNGELLGDKIHILE
jgi:hypothetical protein